MRYLYASLVLAGFSIAACGDSFAVPCERTHTCASATGGNGGATGGANGSGGGGEGGESGDSGGSDSGSCSPECPEEAPVCDVDEKECVQCLEDDHCGDRFCVESTNECVDCEGNEHCQDADASLCIDGSCGSCLSNDDCSHIEGASICEGGSCVECVVEDESACGVNSCNPATNTCTDTPRGKTDVCEVCVADSECAENFRCVPMKFGGVARTGGYCLKLATAPGGCGINPYRTASEARMSLSGAEAAPYCTVNEVLATCEAVTDLMNDKGCGTDSDCGAEGLGDGLCTTVNFTPGLCTYSCEGNNVECPTTASCAGAPDNKHCGGTPL